MHKLYSFRKTRLNSVEAYAKDYKRLHPLIIEVSQPFFTANSSILIRRTFDLTDVKVQIGGFGGTFLARFSGRGSPTPAWTWGRTLYFDEGILNKKDGEFDLATVQGFVQLLHELHHVYTWCTLGLWRSLALVLTSSLKSLVYKLRHWGARCWWWNHQLIPLELDAAAFAKECKTKLQDSSTLSMFEDLR